MRRGTRQQAITKRGDRQRCPCKGAAQKEEGKKLPQALQHAAM
jgi:hypothetical protein